MNSIRLILLLLGIAVIAGIFIWDYLQQRKNKRLRTINISGPKLRSPSSYSDDSEDEEYIHELPRLSARQGLDNKNEIPAPPQNKSGNKMSVSADMFTGVPASASTHSYETTETAKQKQENTGKIIILHVTARTGRYFSGEDIVHALEQLHFQFGKMNIFHHYGMDAIRSDHPLFSVVNMMEPGYFEPDTISQLSTPGISLFLCLPLPLEAEVVFEFMLNIAQQLAVQLDGEVRDEKHRLIDEYFIANIKYRLARTD